MKEKVEPRFMGVDDAETYSGISKWTWRRKAYAGEIASVKVGRRLLIPVAEIDRILKQARSLPPTTVIEGE